MNKAELIDAVHKEMCKDSGYNRIMAERAVNGFVDVVTDRLAKGEKVAIQGFGTFETAQKAARTGRNPHTGAPVAIPAKTVARFKPGKALKEALDG